MIVDDEDDGHMSDNTDDSDDYSDVEPEAATAKDLDRNSENSTNSALECEDRCSLHEEQSSPTSSSDDEQSFSGDAANGYKSRTGRQWSKTISKKKGRASARDVLRPPPGVKVHAENRESIAETFRLFLSENIVKHVTRCTNMKYEEYVKQNPSKRISLRFNGFQPLEEMEVEAGIGLLIFQGLCHSSRETLHELWTLSSHPIYRAVMSRDRFKLLLKFLRFDDFHTRSVRRGLDRFAPFREVWEMFVANCRTVYLPGECVTVDEQLVTFRGRCVFRQYMPSKPGRYGIKVWACCDSKNSYCYNAAPYLGKEGNQVTTNLGSKVVKEMIQPLLNTGRNVTMDRFFTDVELCENLLTENLTVVGTIKANRRHLPTALLPVAAKKREPGSIMFAYHQQLTMVSWVPKRHKTVLLLSSMHHDASVIDGKPEIVRYYNSTKAGVDTLDQKVRFNSCRRTTLRWPLAMFFNVVDVAGNNAYTVWNIENLQAPVPLHRRRHWWLKRLSIELCQPLLEYRQQHATRLRAVTTDAMKMMGYNVSQVQPIVRGMRSIAGRGCCYVCPAKRKRKSKQLCDGCEKHVCGEHSRVKMSRRCCNCATENDQ